MTGFCGWIGGSVLSEDRRVALRRMFDALRPSGGPPTEMEVAAGSAVAAVEPARAYRHDGFLIVIRGAPEFRDPELSELAKMSGGETALVELYRRRGAAMPERLGGEFALAVVSEGGEEGILALDRVGGRQPLVYRDLGGSLAFATDGAALDAHPSGECPLDPQGLFHYLYFDVIPGPGTIRKEVRRLEPGTSLRFRSGAWKTHRYWAPRYVEDRSASLGELEEEFHRLLRSSVRKAAGDSRRIGCFLSGGTDSSTVVGVLAETVGSARAYAIGFKAQGYDEMEYARTAAAHFGAELREYYLTPRDVLEAIPRVAAAHGDPFGNASALPALFCARMAKEDGVERLLGGDGGDELFAGNERYATQKTFELYGRVPSFLRRALLEPVLLGVPGGDGIPLLRKARSYVRQARIPMPMRTQSYNHLERTGIEHVLEPEFLKAVDREAPHKILRDVYEGAEADGMLNRFLALDLKLTLADNDLPKVSRSCESAGVEVGYPFLTDEMMEFSFRVPARLKLRAWKLRWFFKHALRDFLPGKILAKKKHGFGLPFGLWMRDDPELAAFARDNLDSLGRRGIVRPDYVRELLRLHSLEHPVYYGVMIWTLTMLEQWFRSRSYHS